MFQIKFQSQSTFDEDNRQVMSLIQAAEKDCCKFNLCCEAYLGFWGIWLEMDDKRLLVNPYDLVSSIYKDDRYYLFDTPKDDVDYPEYDGDFFVDIRCNHYVFEWQMHHKKECYNPRYIFKFEEYLSKIIKAITFLHQVWKEQKPIAYTPFDCELESVEICLSQLQIKHTLPSHYALLAKDVIIESFQFFPKKDKYAEGYSIGVGNRTFDTILTHLDSDFEQIRHQLECIAYEEEASIRLPFDMSDTIVKLRKTSLINEMIKNEKGVVYKHKDFMIVEIEPNDFVHKPIIKGYCDRKEAVKTFYEGLLKLAMCHPETQNNCIVDHEPTRLIAYNKLKSPIVENYLKEIYSNDDEYCIRQVHVKHILRIYPDYDVIMWDEENVAWSDLDELYDKYGNPIVMPELKEWQEEINPIVVDSETGYPYEKDWEDYHRRGLELAHQLREKLSTDFDLWYDAPFEDKSGTIPKSILII